MDSSEVMSMDSGSAVEGLLGEESLSLEMASSAREMSPRADRMMWYGSGRAKRAFAVSNPWGG